MRLGTFRDPEVLYEEEPEGTTAFTGLKRVSVRALRAEVKNTPYEFVFDHPDDNETVRIRFGVPPKKGSANVACPVTMTNSRGTLAIQSHRTAESKPLHGADANAWLDTNADAFDIVVYSNGFKTLRCRAQLRALRSEQPELFNSRKGRAAGKRTKHR